MVFIAGCQNSTAALNSLHRSIRSKVEINLADVCGFDTRRAPRNCSRFVCWYDFHEDFLNSVYVTILMYCCTVLGLQYVALANILSDSGERMPKIPPQQMHAACGIVTRGSRCYAPHIRENLLPVRIIRRQKAIHQTILVQTTRFAVFWGVHLD